VNNLEPSTPSLKIYTNDELLWADCVQSLHTFVKTFWHIIEPKRPFVDNWHIQAICEHLQAVTRRDIQNLLITMPPRMLKSTLCSVMWPAWSWTFEPSHRWLTSTYAQNLSIRDAIKMRRIIESDLYQRLFGPIILQDDQNTKQKFENKQSGCRLSTSVGGLMTGEGGDTLMIDDPHNALEIHSDTKRKGVIDWYKEAFSTRLNDENKGAKLIIMQRLHEGDLAGWVLEHDQFEHLILPMEYVESTHVTSIGFSDPRKVDGELLFPERLDQSRVNEFKKKLGSLGYSGQFQQSPVPAEGNIIREKDLRYYKEPPKDIEKSGIYVDMAFEGEEDSDFNVAFHIGKRGPDFFLLPDTPLRGRWNFPQAMFHMEHFITRLKSNNIMFEKKANGHAAIAIFKKKFSGIREYVPKVSKEERVYQVQPIFEAGNVWFPDPQNWPWVTEIIKEVLLFPKARHDDCVDVLTMGINDLNKSTESYFKTVGKRTYG